MNFNKIKDRFHPDLYQIWIPVSIQKKCYSGYLKLSLLFLCSTLLLAACSEANTESEVYNISVNGVGYHPDYPKLAIVSYDDPGEVFQLLDAETLQPIYEGIIQKTEVPDSISGDLVHKLDFSNFTHPGLYKLFIPAREDISGVFEINHSVYNQALITAMESFYYQRCGTKVDNGTSWSHPVCHLDDAPFYDKRDSSKVVTGGWHDAGDYNKFIVPTAFSSALQLYLFEHKAKHFMDGQLNIPESGNGIPDLLDEVRWGLEWMLKMQNEDGGVHYKISEKKWTGEYMPHQDPDVRYIFAVSSTATADFAAVTALASQIYKDYDNEFAATLKKASEKAWDFLVNRPEIVPENGFTNPPDVIGGEYRDTRDLDERLWAATELYRLTSSDKYHKWFLNHFRDNGMMYTEPLSWQNVAMFAWSSYLRTPESFQNQEARQYILSELINHANQIVQRVEDSEYRIALNANEYYWGSNSIVLGYAFELVQVFEYTDQEKYRRAALDQLHYILGRNPFGMSYVTGVGFNPVQNPYHQFSIKLNQSAPVPGMVVGGPNIANNLNDIIISEYPLKAYEDSEKNYMVNETAINYTAPFIYLAGYFSNFTIEPDPVTYLRSNYNH